MMSSFVGAVRPSDAAAPSRSRWRGQWGRSRSTKSASWVNTKAMLICRRKIASLQVATLRLLLGELACFDVFWAAKTKVWGTGDGSLHHCDLRWRLEFQEFMHLTGCQVHVLKMNAHDGMHRKNGSILCKFEPRKQTTSYIPWNLASKWDPDFIENFMAYFILNPTWMGTLSSPTPPKTNERPLKGGSFQKGRHNSSNH